MCNYPPNPSAFALAAVIALAVSPPALPNARELEPAMPADGPPSVLRVRRLLGPAGPGAELVAFAGRAAGCTGPLMFDAFEPGPHSQPTDGVVNGGRDPCCDVAATTCAAYSAGTRYFLGSTYTSPNVVDDFTVAPGFEGVSAGRVALAFYWFAAGGTSSEPCTVALRIYDDFDSAGGTVPFAGFIDGFVAELANVDTNGDGTLDALRSSQTAGYYVLDLDVCSAGGLALPADGSGAYQLIFALSAADGDGDGTLEFAYATAAQPMLWGVKPGSPGAHNNLRWFDDRTCAVPPQPSGECGTDLNGDGTIACDFVHDGVIRIPGNDNAPDGAFTAPCERGPFPLRGCPVALNAMVCLYAAEPACSAESCADSNCDGEVDAFDITGFLLALTNPPAYDLENPGCDRICATDTNGDSEVDAFDIAGFVSALVGSACPR